MVVRVGVGYARFSSDGHLNLIAQQTATREAEDTREVKFRCWAIWLIWFSISFQVVGIEKLKTTSSGAYLFAAFKRAEYTALL